jgi:hypothetical protein
MRKTSVAKPKVRCGTCRMFDGYTWCRHWNFFTTADAPPCNFYRRRPSEPTEAPGPDSPATPARPDRQRSSL